MCENAILEIENLKLSFMGTDGRVPAVCGVSFAVYPGEVVALVGESGCGKTALCRAIMGLHASHAVVEEGAIRLCGRKVSAMTEKELETVRGRDAAMVFQDPMTSLNPTVSVGRQIAEAILAHQKVSRAAAKERAMELLRLVEIPQPEIRYSQYPHHFSGGMRQRIAIAIAMALNPALLIADEPTTSLDIMTQNRIMALLAQLCKPAAPGRPVQLDSAAPAAVRDPACAAFGAATAAAPGITDLNRTAVRDLSTDLNQITSRSSGASSGTAAPDPGPGRGMLFVTHDLGLAERLADRVAVMQAGRIVEIGRTEDIFRHPSHEYTKKLLGYAAYGKGNSHYHGRLQEPESAARRTPQCDGKPLVQVSHVTKRFSMGGTGGKRQVQTVLDDFSMNLYKGEIVGVVGPSGCGKSTLARCIMGIYEPEQGRICIEPECRKQMIFQDSASAFNPRMTLEDIIAEPLIIKGRRPVLPLSRRPDQRIRLGKAELHQKVLTMMEQVGLSPELAGRYPYDVSGGQRQRAAIARALITGPDLIIADEPISSLDVSIQSQIIHLLKELHDRHQLTMLLIAHDLPMVSHISDRIVEMKPFCPW